MRTDHWHLDFDSIEIKCESENQDFDWKFIIKKLKLMEKYNKLKVLEII